MVRLGISKMPLESYPGPLSCYIVTNHHHQGREKLRAVWGLTTQLKREKEKPKNELMMIDKKKQQKLGCSLEGEKE